MATYERLDYGSADGSQWGGAATDKVGFYGKVPVVQRPYSSAVHASSAISSSTDFGATQLAWAQEVTKTLIGLGIWATA
jgi:hypothetical protein